MASTAYIRMMHTPITTHSRNTARVRHEGGQHLVNPIGYYAKVKHIYGFTIYDLMYVNAVVVIDVLLPLSVDIGYYIVQCTADSDQVGNFAPLANRTTAIPAEARRAEVQAVRVSCRRGFRGIRRILRGCLLRQLK